MALIAHWPLNGNTNDISGNGKHGSAHGTLTSSTAGKIGLTYIFENNENGVNISNNNFSGLTSYTMSAWINPAGNHRNYNGTILSSGNWNGTCWAFGVNQTNTAIDAAGRGYNKYINYTFTLNTWTHILSVVSNGVSKVYVNGNYLGQINVTSTLASDATNTFIGRETYASGYFSFNGKINDVRIYDHALTDFEVQELYKTKIIHYTFDNEVESTTNIINTSPLSIYNNHGVPASITTLPITRNGAPIYRVSMTATSTSLSSFRTSYANQGITTSTNSFAANTPHTSSIMWRVKQGPSNIKVRGTPSNIGGWSDRGTYLTDDGWNRTITTRAPYGTTVTDGLFWSFISPDIQLDDVIIIEWTSPQLETKDHFTEFTRTNRDRKQISDLSDFRNNGTLTGDLEITKESAIGNGSIIFDSSNAKININTINPLPSEVSISYWRKTVPEVNGSGWLPFVGQSTSFYIMATSGGTGAFYHSGNVGDRAKNIYIDGVKIGTSTPPVQDNNWHHYVITGLDLSAWTQFNINGYGSSWNMLGNMDDFRMYATTLTDRDIKDLYETKAEIDKGSTLYSKDFTDSVNLLDPDIFYGYANSGTSEKQVFDNRKVWVPYPARFHPNGALRGLFKENTRYKIHLVYTHFTYYSAIENYVPGGLTIRYTDGTEHHLIYTPTGPDPDWRTLNYITPEGKTVSNIWVFYYTSYPLYVSEESFMVEYNKDGISNEGISKFLDYSTVGITDGLIGYWQFNNNTVDYSGNNYHGVEYSAGTKPIVSADNIEFETGDGLKVENIIGQVDRKPFSIIILAEAKSHSGTPRLAMGYPDNVLEINVRSNYAGISLKDSTGFKAANYNAPIPLNEKFLYTGTFDGSTLKYYHNGVYQAQNLGHLNDSAFGNNLLFGNWTSLGQTFQGKIYYAKVFNRALTPEEIAIEYNTMFNNEVQIHESGVLYAKDIIQY